MKIETERLVLREYTMDDFDSLYEIVSDQETMKHYPSPFDEEKTRGWISWNIENYQKYGFGLWAVTLKENSDLGKKGEFIGDCGITIQNIDGELLPEIGYHINKRLWRKGLGKEAARAVRDWVFEHTDYDSVYSYMKYTNVGSYSTAMANGMKKVKEYADPKNEISYAYCITREEWLSLKKENPVTQNIIEAELLRLGINKGDILEVHSSLKSFGYVDGGAETVIGALQSAVGNEGTIFMPALALSRELELTEEDIKDGLTVKIKKLPEDEIKTAMGVIADTFRSRKDVKTGPGVFRTSGWGKHSEEAVNGGLNYAIHNGGKAVLLGVDIYKLTAMHYVESQTPKEINEVSAPSEQVLKKYPEDQWLIETGHPPVKAWYKIQQMAYDRGLIKEGKIGDCKVMCFNIKDVISIYEDELIHNPFKLWGME